MTVPVGLVWAPLVSAFLLASPFAHAAIPDAVPPQASPSPARQPEDPVALREMQVHFLIASEYYKDRNYWAAIDEWKQVLRIQPNHALAKEKIRKARERMATGRAR